jgi:hypothetical protein
MKSHGVVIVATGVFVVIVFTQAALQYAYPATVSAGTFNAPTLLTNSSSHGSR